MASGLRGLNVHRSFRTDIVSQVNAITSKQGRQSCHGKNGPTQMWSGDQFWQPKAVPPRPVLATKSGPPQTTFGSQKWSHLPKMAPPSKFTEHALYHCKTTSGSQNGGRQPPSKMTIKVVPLHKEFKEKKEMLYQCKSQ